MNVIATKYSDLVCECMVYICMHVLDCVKVSELNRKVMYTAEFRVPPTALKLSTSEVGGGTERFFNCVIIRSDGSVFFYTALIDVYRF